MFRVAWTFIKWLAGLVWALVRRKTIDWGTKLTDLTAIIDRIILLIFKTNPQPAKKRRRLRDFFKRLRRRG